MNQTLLIGEALVDVVHQPNGEVAEHVGGSVLNVATGLARLGHKALLATWVARDARGQRIVGHAVDQGVELVPGSDAADATPIANATLDESGVASYDFELEWRMPLLDDATAGHLHTGSFAATLEPGASDVSATVQAAAERTVSYDPNIRPALMGTPEAVRPIIERLVAAADIVKLSDEDLAWLLPGLDFAALAERWGGPALLVLTRGADGVDVAAAGQLHHLAAPTVSVTDTVGAGDSFMAGLLSGLWDAELLGSERAAAALRAASWQQLRPAVERALATAAITCTHAGAYSPTRDELPTD